jgi:transposase
VIHSTSVAVSREKRRAKTDRVDAEMLLRVFLGRLRGERGHCSMVAVPTIEVEDARRPGREREALVAERHVENGSAVSEPRRAEAHVASWWDPSGST